MTGAAEPDASLDVVTCTAMGPPSFEMTAAVFPSLSLYVLDLNPPLEVDDEAEAYLYVVVVPERVVRVTVLLVVIVSVSLLGPYMLMGLLLPLSLPLPLPPLPSLFVRPSYITVPNNGESATATKIRAIKHT